MQLFNLEGISVKVEYANVIYRVIFEFVWYDFKSPDVFASNPDDYYGYEDLDFEIKAFVRNLSAGDDVNSIGVHIYNDLSNYHLFEKIEKSTRQTIYDVLKSEIRKSISENVSTALEYL